MSNEIYESTKRLIKQLNHFLIHVVLYFFINLAIIVLAFGDINKRWWMFFIIVFWALGLIYHGLRVYGLDPLNRKNKKTHLLCSVGI